MVYEDLKLKVSDSFNKTFINGEQIKVFDYLPIEDKMDLVNIALQNSESEGLYDPMKLEVFFNLYLVEMYTDIIFSDEQKADPYQLYNELESNGVIDIVINAMSDEEYKILQEFLKQVKKEKESYKRSIPGFLEKFIQDMPKQAEAAAQIVNNFDPEKYKQVIEFAKAANGGREI